MSAVISAAVRGGRRADLVDEAAEELAEDPVAADPHGPVLAASGPGAGWRAHLGAVDVDAQRRSGPRSSARCVQVAIATGAGAAASMIGVVNTRAGREAGAGCWRTARKRAGRAAPSSTTERQVPSATGFTQASTRAARRQVELRRGRRP